MERHQKTSEEEVVAEYEQAQPYTEDNGLLMTRFSAKKTVQ